MTTAFLLRSGDTVYTSNDREEQPSFLDGWATKVYMDDAYYVITVRYASYSARERLLTNLIRAWPGLSFERGDGLTTLTVFLPHYA